MPFSQGADMKSSGGKNHTNFISDCGVKDSGVFLPHLQVIPVLMHCRGSLDAKPPSDCQASSSLQEEKGMEVSGCD